MCCKLCWYVEWLYGILKMRCFRDATDQNDGFGLTLGVPMGLFPAGEQFLKADLQKSHRHSPTRQIEHDEHDKITKCIDVLQF